MGAQKAKPLSGTGDLILNVAERRAQVLGFNGFSYGDIAGELGVSTASIHYHFPTKSDLGVRLVERYTQRFSVALAEIAADPMNACDKLARYAAIYEDVLKGGRLCLCGMLAAEIESLPAPMRTQVREFFARNEDWLVRVLEEGAAAGDIALDVDARATARAVTAMLEGALIVARAHGGLTSFRAATQILLRALCRHGGH